MEIKTNTRPEGGILTGSGPGPWKGGAFPIPVIQVARPSIAGNRESALEWCRAKAQVGALTDHHFSAVGPGGCPYGSSLFGSGGRSIPRK